MSDLNEIRRWLNALPDVAARTERRLEDLHSLAFDQHVADRDGARSTRIDWALDEIGERKAKELWRRAVKATHAALVELEAVSHAIGQYLNAGEVADNTMRGTLLGDDETAASAELADLVRRQNTRRERGDYTPAREMAQPQVPRR
jgi:hypothetical protein